MPPPNPSPTLGQAAARVMLERVSRGELTLTRTDWGLTEEEHKTSALPRFLEAEG